MITNLLVVALSALGAAALPACPAEGVEKKRVLILGDSISMGYTPFLQEALRDQAVVIRPAENCEGTTLGVGSLETWLRLDGGRWDVIHFNFGLHDLKSVDPTTGAATANPEDPRQASPEQYEANLRQIVTHLRATGAALIWASTTPVPEGRVNPHRTPADVLRYNEIARRIMVEHAIPIDDLYAFALPRLSEIQQPVNVHFTPEGYRALAHQVAAAILAIH